MTKFSSIQVIKLTRVPWESDFKPNRRKTLKLKVIKTKLDCLATWSKSVSRCIPDQRSH
jgi:hypothetical protein